MNTISPTCESPCTITERPRSAFCSNTLGSFGSEHPSDSHTSSGSSTVRTVKRGVGNITIHSRPRPRRHRPPPRPRGAPACAGKSLMSPAHRTAPPVLLW
eukprot:gene5986-biopygen2977